MSSLSYTLTPSRRTRSIRISVSHDGSVSVSAPPWVTSGKVERFVEEKRGWIEGKIAQFQKRGPLTVISHARKDKKMHVEKTRALVTERLAYFNQYYGYKLGRITIRDQKSRWGSCSKKGNLNFNYKMALLPCHLVDYIVVHELCHIGQFDHSKAFWDLVAQQIPDHKAYRKELRMMSFVSSK